MDSPSANCVIILFYLAVIVLVLATFNNLLLFSIYVSHLDMV